MYWGWVGAGAAATCILRPVVLVVYVGAAMPPYVVMPPMMMGPPSTFPLKSAMTPSLGAVTVLSAGHPVIDPIDWAVEPHAGPLPPEPPPLVPALLLPA